MVANDLGFVHLAVLRHDLKELKDVLSRGEKADQVDREGRTPLFYPARDGEVAIALELLAHGANPNAQESRNSAAFRRSKLPNANRGSICCNTVQVWMCKIGTEIRRCGEPYSSRAAVVR